MDGLLLAPIDRTALWVAKVLSLLAYLAVVELVAVPAFAVLLLGPELPPALPGLIATLAVADVGIAAVGALVAALAAESRARELVSALLLLPLLVPVAVAASAATAPLLVAEPSTAGLGGWLALLAAYAVLFVLLAVAVFDYLLED
jgi:heme exporter protein B